MSRPTARRIAIFGGNGRIPHKWSHEPNVTCFQSQGDGGEGDLRRLKQAVKSGSFDEVVLLIRWCSHSSTRMLTRLCKQRGVRVVMQP